MTNPELLTYPFAFDGDRNSIPEKQEVTWNGLFSEKIGFPEETSIPTISGGKNVQRKDMNGAFYFLSNILFYLQKGKIFVWDAGQVYYTPALVSYTDDEEVTTFYVCIKDTESIGPITPNGDEVPATEGWYERKKVTEYVTSKDTVVDTTKIYYRFVTNEYIPVTPWTGANPATIGWYELKDGTYVLSTDTKVDAAKTYYRYAQNEYIAVTPTGTESPKSKGWYELNTYFKYIVTEDQLVLSSKVYYKTLGTAPNADTTHWMSIYDYLFIPPEASFNNLLADRAWVHEHTQAKTAHFRGHFLTWADVPTTIDGYLPDYDGERTPTVNDYIVVENASDYPMTDTLRAFVATLEHIAPDVFTVLNGRWFYTFTGEWTASINKGGWVPRYQIDEQLSTAQKNAINSGVDATLTAQITTNKNNIGEHSTTQTYNFIDSTKSDRENLDILDAKAGAAVSGNYIKASDTIFANINTLDTKIGAQDSGHYIVADNTVFANLKTLDTKIGALSADGNYITVENTVLANVNGVDTAIGKLSTDGNYILVTKNVYENVVILDTKAGKLSADGNYIKVENTFLDNVSILDTQIGALTEDGNYITISNKVLDNIKALDTKAGALIADGHYIKVASTILDNISIIDTKIGILTADGNYVLKNNTICANITALDTQVKTNTDAIALIEGKIDSNVSSDNQMQGKTYIDEADKAIDDKISTAATSNNRATDKKYVDDADTALSDRITTNATNISNLDTLKAPLESPALTGTPTAPTAIKNTSTTQIATTEFVVTEIEDKISTADALLYKGAIEGGNTGAYGALTPTAHRGWLYKVSVAGKIDGVAVEVGDVLICNTDKTAKATASNYTTIVKNWDFIQTNIDGAVIGPESALDTHIATFNGASGKLIQDSGFTIKTSVPENAVFTDHITTTEDSGTGNGVASVTADANGKLTVAKTTFLVAADIESKADKTYVDDEVGKINAKIPAEATSLNQLADKQFVDTELLEKVGFTDYASNTKAGAVKIDDNTLKITDNGVLYVWSAGDVAVELDNSKTYISALKYTDKSATPTKTYYVDTRAVRNADDQSQTLYSELTDIETNKPNRSELKTVAFTGSYTDLTNKYELPKATAETLGGVKQGTGVTIDSDGVLSCYSDSTFYNNGTSGNIDPSNGRTQLTSATTIVMGEPLQNMSTTVMLWCSSGAVTFDTTTGANVIFPQGVVLPTATSGIVIYQLMGIGAGFWCATCLGVFDADVEYWNYDPTTKTLTFVEAGNTFSYDESEKTLATTSSRFSYDGDTETIVHE